MPLLVCVTLYRVAAEVGVYRSKRKSALLIICYALVIYDNKAMLA